MAKKKGRDVEKKYLKTCKASHNVFLTPNVCDIIESAI
jgi:hypothetical protein